MSSSTPVPGGGGAGGSRETATCSMSSERNDKRQVNCFFAMVKISLMRRVFTEQK
jgi:hypothetical protein